MQLPFLFEQKCSSNISSNRRKHSYLSQIHANERSEKQCGERNEIEMVMWEDGGSNVPIYGSRVFLNLLRHWIVRICPPLHNVIWGVVGNGTIASEVDAAPRGSLFTAQVVDVGDQNAEAALHTPQCNFKSAPAKEWCRVFSSGSCPRRTWQSMSDQAILCTMSMHQIFCEV